MLLLWTFYFYLLELFPNCLPNSDLSDSEKKTKNKILKFLPHNCGGICGQGVEVKWGHKKYRCFIATVTLRSRWNQLCLTVRYATCLICSFWAELTVELSVNQLLDIGWTSTLINWYIVWCTIKINFKSRDIPSWICSCDTRSEDSHFCCSCTLCCRAGDSYSSTTTQNGVDLTESLFSLDLFINWNVKK